MARYDAESRVCHRPYLRGTAAPQRPLGGQAAAIEQLGRSTEGPAWRCGVRRPFPEAGRLSSLVREVAAMAMAEQLYPRSSIEDDFNYGSNVASASVHIRMGRDWG